MMKHSLHATRLAAACLAALSLAACSPGGLVPAATVPAIPGIAASTSSLSFDSHQDGDVSVRLSLAPRTAAARKLLYVGTEIETLDIALLWLNNGQAEPTQVDLVTLSQAQILTSPALTFSKLKRGRDYRVVATARATVGGMSTIINDVDQSRVGFSIDDHQVMTPALVGDLPIVLNDTPVVIHEAGATIGATTGTGQADPTLAVGVTPNDVTAVGLTFDGTVAKVQWSSTKGGVSDYDVQIVDAATGNNLVVDATGVDREGATTHKRSFEMGNAPLGNYEAKVCIKDRPMHLSSAAAFNRHVATVGLTYSGTNATVAWTSLTATRADYDVQLFDALGTMVDQDVAIDERTGLSHSKAFSLSGKPYQAYTAKVRLKDRALSEHSDTAYRVNVISGVTISITGSVATLQWASTATEATDYDVYLVNETDHSTVVASKETVASVTGTTHTDTISLSNVAPGSYKAKVVNKGDSASAKYSAATTYSDVISDVVVTYSGAQATVAWTSATAAPIDYDVYLVNATDDSIVVASNVGVGAVSSTTHSATVDVTNVAPGNYKAKVVSKDAQATPKYSADSAYAGLISGVAITYSGAQATVTWTSASTNAIDFDVEILDASGNMVKDDLAVSAVSGTSHSATIALTGVAYASYKAKVFIKGHPATAITGSPVAYSATTTEAISVLQLVMRQSNTSATVTFKTVSDNSHTYTYKFYQLDVSDTEMPTVAHYSSAPTTSSGSPSRSFVLPVGAAPLFAFGKNYVVEVYEGATLLGTSSPAYYNEFGDPIIFECTVDGPDSTCDIF